MQPAASGTRSELQTSEEPGTRTPACRDSRTWLGPARDLLGSGRKPDRMTQIRAPRRAVAAARGTRESELRRRLDEEKRFDSWSTLAAFLPYLWPPGRTDLRL